MLVHVPGCPSCGTLELSTFSWVEEPLVRGGGYGAARITRVVSCLICHWEMVREVSEVRPLRRRLVA